MDRVKIAAAFIVTALIALLGYMVTPQAFAQNTAGT